MKSRASKRVHGEVVYAGVCSAAKPAPLIGTYSAVHVIASSFLLHKHSAFRTAGNVLMSGPVLKLSIHYLVAVQVGVSLSVAKGADVHAACAANRNFISFFH